VLSHVLPGWLVKASRVLVDLFAAAVCAIIAWQAWRYLELEIEFDDRVLVDTPAWVAHIVVPIAFALVSYRFVILAVKDVGEIVTNSTERAAE
jgi:TRAP-type C4-dicarboxylate transport system permease small subunit